MDMKRDTEDPVELCTYLGIDNAYLSNSSNNNAYLSYIIFSPLYRDGQTKA